jgi:hypothetical protein
MDYLRRLVNYNIINEVALNIAQSKRDSPTHGVGLNPVGQPRPQYVEQAAPYESSWVWDEEHKRYRHWDGQQWIWAPEA